MRGIVNYIGNSSSLGSNRWTREVIPFRKMTDKELFLTRFNLWRQAPWKKIKGKVILKAKIGGEISLTASPSSGFQFGKTADFEEVKTVADITKMLFYGAQDPRVQAILIEFERLEAGYAKLTELRRELITSIKY
jgi:hypothetical protein